MSVSASTAGGNGGSGSGTGSIGGAGGSATVTSATGSSGGGGAVDISTKQTRRQRRRPYFRYWRCRRQWHRFEHLQRDRWLDVRHIEVSPKKPTAAREDSVTAPTVGKGAHTSPFLPASNPGGGAIFATATALSGVGGNTLNAGTPGNSGDATATINVTNLSDRAEPLPAHRRRGAGLNSTNMAKGTRGIGTAMAHATTAGGFLADARASADRPQCLGDCDRRHLQWSSQLDDAVRHRQPCEYRYGFQDSAPLRPGGQRF